MGTRAIFRFYKDGKFLLGSWVKWDGGLSANSIFPDVMNLLYRDINPTKLSLFHTIKDYVVDSRFPHLFGDKKDPFKYQIQNEAILGDDVLFWDIPLSDKKLMEKYLWGEYIYEIRFVKGGIKIKINHNGNEKEYALKGYRTHDKVLKIIKDAQDWDYELEYGLNDCNCGEENKEITEENI
jgi:hypothetical protein